MNSHKYFYIKSNKTWQCLAGIRVRRLLSAELFLDISDPSPHTQHSSSLAQRCRDRWIDLAGSLAAMPNSSELHLIMSCRPAKSPNPPVLENSLMAIGRGLSKTAARNKCKKSLENLSTLFTAIIDYAEFEPISNSRDLKNLVGYLSASKVVELRRRREFIHIGKEKESGQTVLGFATPPKSKPSTDAETTNLEIPHLFPWVPSDDSWWRLVNVMAKEPGPTSLVVHVKGWNSVPKSCLAEAHQNLSGVERVIRLVDGEVDPLQILQLKARALRDEALIRLTVLESPLISGRVFLTSKKKPSDALLSVLKSSVDDPSVNFDEPAGRLLFRGGAHCLVRDPGEILLPMDNPELDLFFSPREAPSILRTPMPTDDEFPGFPLNRARTAPFIGTHGSDCPLGRNVHHGLHREVSLHPEGRPRHSYIIGQTGTGKSTLLLHNVLHDINEGRGVALLDPHGSLIDDVLQRYPKHRADDLVLMDLTDVENPVGFNPLLLDEKDDFAYRVRRDLLIDELYNYLDKTYDLSRTGGPIFETHFRSMMGLLLGFEPPREPLVPNLLIFRQLYTNSKLRARLTKQISGKDNMLEEFIQEAQAAQGEAGLSNLAPYITSKFSRFIADANLRNITCQNRSLNIDSIVKEKKVLLVNLGKGRIGEYAAGLLASQIVSRIHHAVIRQGSGKRAKPFYLFADEFQLVASSRFSEMLAEGRKFGLSVTIAHQHTAQIPPDILRSVIGNVGTTILFRVGAQDSDFLAPLFLPTFGRRDLMSLPNFRAYVKGTGALGDGAFNVDVPPPGDKAGVRWAQSLRKMSRKKYGRPRRVVEEEISATIQAFREMR